MILELNKDNIFAFDINRKNKKYWLNIKIKNKFINYEFFSKIKYENLIFIIENIENMVFSRYRYSEDLNLERIRFAFSDINLNLKITLKIDENQEYSITLNRKNVIKLYNYLTRYLNTLNKMQINNFNKKYTFVKVRYIDVYCSKLYSYISEDKSIKIGDIVYVDRAGEKCLAVVKDKDEYYYDEAPYPVLETKRVIKIVTRVEK